MAHSKWTRRGLIKAGGVAAAAAALMHGGARRSAAAQEMPKPIAAGARPHNIIFFVSDGMSTGTLTMAQGFAQLVRGRDAVLNWQAMSQRPGASVGLVETYSLNSLVTDSAAAASAWGSGSRVNSGSVNVLPDGRELTPIAHLLKQNGQRIGLVTTATVSHATPAGFASVQASRGDEPLIAAQYLDHVDVVLGGGRHHFDPANRADKRDLVDEFVKSGYTFVSNRTELLEASAPAKTLGLFSPGMMPYTIDHRQHEEMRAGIPTLAEMTRSAIQSLDQGSNGFFLMVEGARIDHAAHGNDTAALLWDQLAFDDAIGEALAYAAGQDDTLILITTDHANGNPGLSVGGHEYFENLRHITASFEVLLPKIQSADANYSPDVLISVIKETMGYDTPPAHAAILSAALRKEELAEIYHQHRNPVGVMGRILGNYIGVGWVGVSHTSDYAIFSAWGPGAEQFAGLHRNTDAFHSITQLVGIDFQNPSMPPGIDWRIAQGPSPDSVESMDWSAWHV